MNISREIKPATDLPLFSAFRIGAEKESIKARVISSNNYGNDPHTLEGSYSQCLSASDLSPTPSAETDRQSLVLFLSRFRRFSLLFFPRCQTRLFLYSLLSRNSQNYDNSSSSPRAAYRLHHLRTAVGSAISTRLRLVLDLDANLTTLFSLSSRLRPSLSRIDTSRRDNSISRPRETIKTSRFPANI